MFVRKDFDKNTYGIEFAKDSSEVVTFLGKAGSGLISYSKAILTENLKANYKVSYITDLGNLDLVLNLDVYFSEKSNFKVYPNEKESESEKLNYPKLINDETTDILFINCYNTLTDSEKDYLFKTPHKFIIVVLHQVSDGFKVDIDALASINQELIRQSDSVAYIERNQNGGIDFALLKH